MFDVEDTIVAIASAVGPATRGIVRISGPVALAILDQLSQSGICFPTVIHPVDRLETKVTSPSCFDGAVDLGGLIGVLPCQFLVWPTVRSYTGQPIVEYHLLGAEPILNALIRRCIQLGARPARPGEFTLRAFLAGRMDLAQCEAVLGVVDAHDQQALQSALVQLAGGLSKPLVDVRNRLLDLLAEIEAGLDFADEDLDLISSARLQNDLSEAIAVVADSRQRLRTRRLATLQRRVVLSGLPNVGKSSLLNAIVGQQATIVSSQAGTTRDWVTFETTHAGLVIQWIDTAGLELEAQNAIEITAQKFSHDQFAEADLRVVCIDLSRAHLTAWEQSWLAADSDHQRLMCVGTKSDAAHCECPCVLSTSSQTGIGIAELRQAVIEYFQDSDVNDSHRLQFVASTSQRCAASLERAATALDRGKKLIGHGFDELLAAEIRIALEAIGDLTGHVYNEEVLDRIFSRFCIGK